MSQTKYWAVSRGTVTRVKDDGSGGEGCGNSKRFYVGRSDESSASRRNYASYLDWVADWSGIGKIVSATLIIYTDDRNGARMPNGFTATDHPTVVVRRLKAAFSEGTNADDVFDSSDYTTAAATTSGQKKAVMAKAPGALNRIDVTSFVGDWADSSIQRPDGTPGGKAAQYGLLLAANSGSNLDDWSGWSEDATDPSVRPQLEIVYEYGKTAPNTPTSLTPVGSIGSLTAFAADFSDVDSRDTLASSQVEVYVNTTTNSGQTIVGALPTAPPVNHKHVTEREGAHKYPSGAADDSAWEDCTITAGLEFARLCHDKNISATHLEMETLRWKAGLGPTGGSNIGDLVNGLSKRYKWTTGYTTQTNFTDLWAALSVGVAAVVQGSMGAFSNGHSLRRWDPAFAGGHAILAVRTDSQDRVWWCDPLAPTNVSYLGEFVTKTQLQDFFNALGGAQALTALMQGPPSGLLWDSTPQKASNTEVVTHRSNLIPKGLTLSARVAYKWRVRHTDQEGSVSPWSDLYSFTITNTDPSPPTISPSGASLATLNGVLFRGGTFADADPDDSLDAYQVQLSAYPSGDAHWLSDDFILWDTGKVYTPADADDWETPYGGLGLLAGTYYIRARQWDQHEGISAWAYAPITLTANFVPDPGSQSSIQIDPHAPWRIVFKAMNVDGHRGPGAVVAILENSKSVGASIVYNSPGELHFTVPVDHPQISVLEPKQTHYAVELYSGDGWREVFAGLLWDYDATETSVVFYGIDYLALFDYVLDERFDPSQPDLPASKGGSKYVDKQIDYVVNDQLVRATSMTNSPVDFISVGAIAVMGEHVTLWSTMQSTLGFISGLLDSHRQGTGKKTRLLVRKTSGGGYEVVVLDDPGTTRDNMRLKYGELVQGYRVIPFGTDWASLQHSIGRTREGIKVMYKTQSAPGIDQAIWGRFAQAKMFDGVSDENDLIRRTKQAAIEAGKLGKKIALGVRSGVLQPRDGYDVCDAIPVDIVHGAVDTEAFGSGYWVIMAIAWETNDDGNQSVNLTLLPRDDATAPDTNLIPTAPISPQAEWQIGWAPPDPLKATSRYWLDQSTGKVYIRNVTSGITLTPITGTH